MVKNKNIKNKTVRYDSTMLVVAACMVVGGFFVFKSYARTNAPTTSPGAVTLSSLPKKGVLYSFSLNSSLKYCFQSPQKYAKVQIYDGGGLVQSESIEDGCFEPKKSYKKPLISITGVSKDSTLLMRKR